VIEFITTYVTVRALWFALAVIIFNAMLIHRAIKIDKYEKN